MMKLILSLLAATAISTATGVIVQAEEMNLNKDKNENVETIENNDIVQAAPVKPKNSAEAAMKETIKVSQEISVAATAYTAECKGCSGTTANGTDLQANPDVKVIAVDPAIIPLGSKVYVEGYGYAVAADTGGGIDGNEIDVYLQEEEDAIEWGRKQVKVTIVEYKG